MKCITFTRSVCTTWIITLIGWTLLVGLPGQTQSSSEETLTAAKLVVPAADKLKAAQKTAKQNFDFKGAKSAEQKAALAKELASKSAESKNEPDLQYALSIEAAELYASIGDAQKACSVIDELSLTFAIPADKTKLALYKKSGLAAKLPTLKKGLAVVGLKLASDAVANEEFAIAKDISTQALAQAKGSGDPATVKRCNDQQAKFIDLLKVWRDVEQARKKLMAEADNSAANETVGRYLCLQRQKWSTGLPFLAKGTDEELRVAANVDLDGADSRALSIADNWWGVADDKKKERSQILPRFAHWAEKALPSLDGIAKSNLEKRITEAYESLSGRAFAKILAETPNGIRSAGTVDCATGAVTSKMTPTFADSQSWLLAMQFNATNLESGPHVLLSWADSRPYADAIVIGLYDNVLRVAIDDCTNGGRQMIYAPLTPEIIGKWVDVKFVHDSVTQEVELYIDNRLIQKDPLTITPRVDQEMPVTLGALDGMQRFTGQIRNVWLVNFK